MTLTEFLLARIAEDEATAQAAIQPDQLHPWGDDSLPRRKPEDFPEDVMGYLGGNWGEHCARWAPLRVLAECEAKGRIVDAAWGDHLQIESEWGRGRSRVELESIADYPDVLRALALPYADHPDFDPEWRV